MGQTDIDAFVTDFDTSVGRVTASLLLMGGAAKEARKSRSLIEALFGRDNLGIAGATAAGAQAARKAAAQAGVTKITSAAPKIFNINIGNVVENFTVQSTTVTEAASEVKRMVTDTIVAAILATPTPTPAAK